MPPVVPGLLRDNQNHARCDNQASLMPVNVVQRKLHPGIMMSGRQADVKPGPLGPRLLAASGLTPACPPNAAPPSDVWQIVAGRGGFDCRATRAPRSNVQDVSRTGSRCHLGRYDTKGATLAGAIRSRACMGAVPGVGYGLRQGGGNCPPVRVANKANASTPAPLSGPSLDNNSLVQVGG